MGPGPTFKDLIRPHLHAYFGYCFEHLWREALPELYRKEGVAAALEFPNPRGATTEKRTFTRQKPPAAHARAGVRWHGVEEMYA